MLEDREWRKTYRGRFLTTKSLNSGLFLSYKILQNGLVKVGNRENLSVSLLLRGEGEQ